MTPDKIIRNAAGQTIAKARMRSIDEFADALNWAIENPRDLSSVDGTPSFTGTKSANEYRDMLRDGWAHGVKDVEGLEGLSTDRAERLTFNRNVGGVFPVVPAALAGAPDAMLDCRPKPVDSTRGLTLVIDASFNCSVKSRDALAYARAVMRLVAWLQAEQIDVSIYVVTCVSMSGERYIYTTCIRECGAVMMPERIAATVHPSWLRRAWFALIEREYHEHKLPGTGVCKSGYGQARTTSPEEMRQILPDAHSVIVLPKVGRGDPEKAIREAVSLKIRRED